MSGSSHLNAKNVGHRECWSAPFLTRYNLRKDHPDTSVALHALGCADSQQQGIGRPDRFIPGRGVQRSRSEEHTSELQSRGHLVCRLLLEKKNYTTSHSPTEHR